MVTRACYFLECAHFVHQCNRGQWPAWIKLHLPTTRPGRGGSGGGGPGGGAGGAHTLSSQPLQRRAQILQLQASKMFYQWAEVGSLESSRLRERVILCGIVHLELYCFKRSPSFYFL